MVSLHQVSPAFIHNVSNHLAAYPNVISQTPCNILAVFNNI